MKTIEHNIRLFKPHAGQIDVIKAIENPVIQYIVLCAGRRWGKSELAINATIKRCLTIPKQRALIMNYRADQKLDMFNNFLRLLQKDGVMAPFVKKVNHSSQEITFINESKVFFRLGSLPSVEGIRGKKFDFIILDEFALYPEKVWETIIQPTLATSENFKVIFCSTPRGKGQFYKLFNMYQTRPQSWISFKKPSDSNPLVSKQFIEDVKVTIPEKIFAQEYKAVFVDDVGSLFENISQSIKVPKLTSNKFYAGVDVGFMNDFTVVTIVNSDYEVVEWLRFNDDTQNFKNAALKIKDVLSKYNYPDTLIEVNRFDSVFTYLRDWNVKNIEALTTTHKSKNEMVENLMRLFSEQLVTVPNDETYINELTDFEYKYNPKTRNITYGAPEGCHDDIVMSLSFATFVATENKDRKSTIIRLKR